MKRETYTRGYYEIVALNNTMLCQWYRDPVEFHNIWSGLKKMPDISNRYIDLGKAIHHYLLQPDTFEEKYSVMGYTEPKSEQMKKFVDLVSDYQYATYGTEVNNYLEEQKNDETYYIRFYCSVYRTATLDPTTIQEKTMQLYQEMYGAIRKQVMARAGIETIAPCTVDKCRCIRSYIEEHEGIRRMLEHPDRFTEFELRWNETEKVHCKALLDLVIEEDDKIILADIKTSSKDVQSFIKAMKTEENYYLQQLHYYMRALKAKGYDKKVETYIIYVSTVNDSIYLIEYDPDEPDRTRRERMMENAIMSINDELSNGYLTHASEYYKSLHKTDFTIG